MRDDLGESLLAAVLAQPDRDEPRLVYADYLQQRGDPQGELINVQIARARGDSTDGLAAREYDLLSRHHAEWAAELGLEPHQVVFERGLASSIGLVPLPRLIALEHRIFDRAPIVRLAFDGLGPDDVRALVATSCLARVKDLILDNNAIEMQGARLLAESPRAANLVRLSLWRNAIGVEGAIALAKSPHLERLRQLDLSYNSIGSAGVKAVLRSPAMASLTRLGLASAAPGRIANVLASAAPRPTLEALNLSDNHIEDAHLTTLAPAPLFETVATLFVARNPFGDEGVQALAQLGRFSRLAFLDLSETRIGDAGVAALAAAPRLSGLRRLRLSKLRPDEGSITDAGALAIAGGQWSGLQELYLVGNHEIGSAAKQRIESRFGEGLIDRVYSGA